MLTALVQILVEIAALITIKCTMVQCVTILPGQLDGTMCDYLTWPVGKEPGHLGSSDANSFPKPLKYYQTLK